MSRSTLGLLVAGAIGLALYVTFRHAAFRWASLDLKLSRSEAMDRARGLLEQRGFRLDGAKSSAAFWTYESSMIYLEKSLGTTKTNQLLEKERLPLWGWEVRFFWPNEKEEYSISLNPEGELIGFRHDFLREKTLPKLSPADALGTAETFLRRTYGAAFEDYELVERSSDQKPNRLDHFFRWKARQSPLDSRLYIRATVFGNELNYVYRELEIPESFTRNERQIESRRNLLSHVVSTIDMALSIVIALFVLWAWRRHWLRWKPAILLSSLLFLVNLLFAFNTLPLQWHGYMTTETVAAFWMSAFGYSLVGSLVTMAWLVLPFGSSDVMGRLLPDAQYSLGELTHKEFFRTSSFFSATLAGFAAAGVQLGFVVGFYLLGQRWLGFYSPIEVPYDNLLSTALPWLQPLLTGLHPALAEETVYRLFAVSLLWKLTGKKWIALLLPALLWGFLHTGYYVEPIYTRGLELTIVGVFLGFVYLRFGIWATILSHYVYNATIASSLLLGSNNRYFQISSAAVIGGVAIPFAWALLRLVSGQRLRKVAFEPLSWPQASVAAHFPANERRHAEKQPLLRLRYPLLLTAAAALGILLLPVKWNFPAMDMGPREAQEFTRLHVTKLGYDVETFLPSVELEPPDEDLVAGKYIRKHLPHGEAQAYLDRYQPALPYWSTRFVAQEEAHECTLDLGPKKEIAAFDCEQPEAAAGKSLPAEASKSIAEKHLVSMRLNPTALEYAGMTETDRPHRKDSSHRWIEPEASVAELRRYLQVGISGDRVSSFHTYLSPPESFSREERQHNFWDALRGILWSVVGVSLIALVIRAFFDRAVLQHIRHPLPRIIGTVSVGLAALNWLNEVPVFWAGYDSTSAIYVYFSKEILELLGEMILMGLLSWAVTLLFMTLPPQKFVHAPTTEDLSRILRLPPWKWRGSRSTFLWAVALIAIQIFEERLLRYFGVDLSTDAFATAFFPFSLFFPAGYAISAIWNSLLIWMTFAVGIAACEKYLKRPITIALLLLYLFATTVGEETSWIERSVIFSHLILLYIVIFRLARFHIAFYLWYSVLGSVLAFVPWFISGQGLFRQQSGLLLGAVTLLTVALFAQRRRTRPVQSPAPSSGP